MSETRTSESMTSERFTATNLGSVLREQGRKRKWLAGRVGTSESLIGKLLNGERTVSRDVAERITAAVGVPFFVLFELYELDDNGPHVGRLDGSQ